MFFYEAKVDVLWKKSEKVGVLCNLCMFDYVCEIWCSMKQSWCFKEQSICTIEKVGVWWNKICLIEYVIWYSLKQRRYLWSKLWVLISKVGVL